MIQTLFGSVEQEPTLLEKLKQGVQKTRAGLVSRLEETLTGRKTIDADLLDELEFALISADIGVKTTEEILDRIKQRVDRKLVGDAGELRGLIREHLLEILQSSERPMPHVAEAPAVVLLVMDATTGQNGLEQARKFTETSGVTGIVLTKLDGTAKGGVVIAIARELNLAIRYVGIGEKVDDLLPFEPERFIESLFEP